MKILLAASEAVPFCKTGGLADVVGALAQKLGAAGHDVVLVLPLYQGIRASALQAGEGRPLSLPLGGGTIDARLRFMQWRKVSVAFVDHPQSFDREGLYGRDGRDHPDNDRRYIVYCRGVLEAAKALGFKPDVLHAHDWQAGLLPAYLRRSYSSDPFFARTASVFTVHNMAYQGIFGRESLDAAGLAAEEFSPERLEYYGKVSFLKAGLVYGDELTTVSATYAREIQQSSDRGFGFEGLLRRRSADLTGILNGIDLEAWDPERDDALPRRFGAKDAALGKAECKAEVRRLGRLADEARLPLVGIVSRLDYQKGLDLALEAVEPRLGRCQLVAVGTGDPALQEAFAALARRRPGAAFFHAGFDDAFARRVYAASDIFLMPSRFEPCGLGQMIAMRYGAVPLVTRTGGLADTVFEAARDGRLANGFVAAPGDAGDLGRALDRALDCHASGPWSERVRAAMSETFSWDAATASYLRVYERALSRLGAAA